MKHWKFRESPAGSPSPSWSDELGISPLLLDLLWRRGFDSRDAMDAFLSSRMADLLHPDQWPGIDEAADLFVRELHAGRKPVVWGDYDVDGITASVVVLDVLDSYGIAAGRRIPLRDEGYGLNIPGIERLAAEGYNLLLTVDCGISDVDAVARARELGMTVVITDHHVPPDRLPPANAICNPRMELAAPCPCPDLAGVGVAFFFMAAVNIRLSRISGSRFKMDDVLDMVALGTLADVMRLTGQNRILVRGGLKKIANARRPGMVALKRVGRFDPAASLTSGQVVFHLAPRINAAGRMDDAGLALLLLRSRDSADALRLARRLDDLNTLRKREETRIWTEAREQALQLLKDRPRAGLVLHGDDWHPGIIGIVASKILEEFYRPTIIVCTDGAGLKGSGRSIREFDLHAGLKECADSLMGFGGHRMAAGLRLAADGLEAFRAQFEQVCEDRLGREPLVPTLTLERELDFSLAGDLEVLQELEMLQPFGPGNAEPVFASPPLVIQERRPLGRDPRNVSLKVRDTSSGVTLVAKAWTMADSFPQEMVGRAIRIAYSPRIDVWNGVPSVDVSIRDWQPA